MIINLYTLQEFAQTSENKLACDIISKYFDMITDRWLTTQHGSYYLGGQISMKPSDEITYDIIKEVKSLLFSSTSTDIYDRYGPSDDEYEFNCINSLIEEMKRRIMCMNGLLRVIVLWISPARKRAAEKIFHPSKMKKSFDAEIANEYN